MNKKNTALIGAGYWGKNIARNLADLGVLHTLCDASEETLKKAKEQYEDVAVTADISKVFNDNDIGNVFIAAPAVMHYELAKAALIAGKNVFVEKPLALNVGDAEELIKIADNEKKILFVGHILNYHPASRKIKEIIAEGKLGRLQYIYSNRLNLGKIRREENILWSFAPHDISLILGLTGEEPSQVESVGSNFLHPDIADITVTSLKFPSGISAHIFVSWLNPFKEQKLVVTGASGMLVFDDTKEIDEKLIFYPHTIEWKAGHPVPKKAEGTPIKLLEGWVEPLKAECLAFLKSTETKEKPITSGEEGLKVLRVLKECQTSIEKKRGAVSSGKDNTTKKPEKEYFAHETGYVDEGAQIGKGTKIWHFSHIYKGAKIGERCILGQNVSIADGVLMGNNVKIQNNVSVYTGTTIEDDVFLGPSCVLTNVTNPRSQVLRHSLYETTVMRRGSTVGANATIVCGITLGRYSFVAAGAVVAKDVPDYALMMGVPAKQKGWMSRHGHMLKNPDKKGIMVCPESGFKYKEVEPGILKCLDLDEDAPLPENLRVGKVLYDEFKKK